MDKDSNVIVRRRPAWLALAHAVGLTMLWATGLLAADRPAGEVWLISTRRAPLCSPGLEADQPLDYWYLDADRQWVPADREAFMAADDPAVPTSVFIHGNRAGHQRAVRMGSDLYRELAKHAGDRPFRFVIWSWPADRIRGRNRYDVRVKAARSDVQSYYLARWVERIDPDVPLGMMGYSFGARVITGALHVLAGGRVAGRALAECPGATRVPVRAVLVAAALDSDWLLPGRRNGLALSRLDRVLITRNGCDPVLRWYPLMYHRHGPQALGYAGPACPGRLGDDQQKLDVLGMSCSVGKAHEWICYLRAPALRDRLAWYAFLELPEARGRRRTPRLAEAAEPADDPAAGGS